MKKRFSFILFIFVLIFSFSIGNIGINTVYASVNEVYLGGIPAGFTLNVRGAYISGLSDVLTKEGVKSPSKDAGIDVGDVILYIDGIEINNAKDVEKAISDKKSKNITIKRGVNTFDVEVKPECDLTGKPKLGLFIRDSINGIGTITYLTKDGFASLGHPILDSDGSIIDIKSGNLFYCNITGHIKGERGKPGELKGTFDNKEIIGGIKSNNETGVFGTLIDKNQLKNLPKIELGEGKPGPAKIYSTIEGNTPKEYSIQIVKSDNQISKIKNYVIKITDKTLLKSTGGIVQGMSGSPIIQDGKLIGAVTHVFINDPTRGFGISIYNMINN